ncbi:MAG: PmoA family protein [Verrucomicrobia bacterium]|nr:PmoA family protein [Verrucomicrobiota bacterium]
MLVYTFDPQKFKPFVQALNTVAGYGVLRNSPGDHLHHHALMYGIKVNGVNFWEETAGCGVQKVVESRPPEILKSADGLPQARLMQVLYWLAPGDAFLPNTNAPALLIERRTLILTVDPVMRETALQWTSDFEVGPGTNVVTLTGANYHGLGMRFLKELDPLAVHLTPEGSPDLSNSKQDVTAHQWEAVAFNDPVKPATIVLFGAPSNARGHARYFAMKTPFAYLSATQGLDLEPLVYRRGDHFQLNYLVTLYPEAKTAEAIAERVRRLR